VALVAQLRRQDLGALRVRAHAMWELMQADRRPRHAPAQADVEPVVVFPDAVVVSAGRRRSLCTVCALAAVDAHDEWTWLACESCLVVDWAAARMVGAERLLPLGRHPLMNAVATARAASGRLDRWRAEESRRVAAKAGLGDTGRVPLARWPAPPGEPLVTSADAFARLLTQVVPDLVATEPRLAQPAALQAAVTRGSC
jgi:hypothetical protein